MKTKILFAIYNFFYWLDVKLGKENSYGYETAPYCGFHFNGHDGKFTSSRYHEGMGSCSTRSFFGYSIVNHSDEGIFIAKPKMS